MIVSDVMARDVVTLMPGHSVKHAAQIMLKHRVSGAPVVEDGEVVGILTEGDLLRRVELGQQNPPPPWSAPASPEGAARDYVRAHSWRVSDVMSRPVVTISENASLADVAILLGTRGIKRLPVVRDGQLVGVVSRADLLKIVAAAMPEPIAGGDEALLISAEAHLREAAGLFARQPDVTVANGVIHLWGTVRSPAERDAARVACEHVPGIAGIEDHLTVVTRAQ